MRAYEIMVILRPTLDEQAVGEFLERVSALIANNGGAVEKVDKWGKRRFSYEIDDLREGTYLVIDFSGTPQTTAELSRVLRLMEVVLRHMIVSREQPVVREPQPEPSEEQPEPSEEQPEPSEEQPEPSEEQPEPSEEQPEQSTEQSEQAEEQHLGQ